MRVRFGKVEVKVGIDVEEDALLVVAVVVLDFPLDLPIGIEILDCLNSQREKFKIQSSMCV